VVLQVRPLIPGVISAQQSKSQKAARVACEGLLSFAFSCAIAWKHGSSSCGTSAGCNCAAAEAVTAVVAAAAAGEVQQALPESMAAAAVEHLQGIHKDEEPAAAAAAAAAVVVQMRPFSRGVQCTTEQQKQLWHSIRGKRFCFLHNSASQALPAMRNNRIYITAP
jgi:hypothetical protein